MNPDDLIKAAPAIAKPTKRATRILTVAVLVSAPAFAQSADITGWQSLPWGSTKPVALKVLQAFHVHECRPAEPSCGGTPGTDELLIEGFRLNGVIYRVNLFFLSKDGLGRVTMTSDDVRDAFQKALSELTGRYGKPGLKSEYDGDREVTRTLWNWLTPHGKVSLASENGEGTSAVFTITYEPRLENASRQSAK